MALLYGLLAAPATMEEADQALCALRRALPRRTADAPAVLLFCDLPDAQQARAPQDDALIRRLQSGVMSVERRRPGHALLLVRRRAWDDAARCYLGAHQAADPGRVLAQLITTGRTDAVFDAATFTPGSLKGRFDAVLLADVRLACTPDTPRRMAACLATCPGGSVRAQVCFLPREEEPLLTALLRQGFSLEPGQPAFPRTPLMATPAALLRGCRDAPEAAECVFVATGQPTVPDLIHSARLRAMRSGDLRTLLPAARLLALLLAALWGSAAVALLALILPELPALLHPRQLPGALVRATLLPMHAFSVLDACLARLMARSPHVRIALPRAAFSPAACVLSGAVLLAMALSGIHALVPLFPVALLWLFAPVIVRALHSPARERIPLSADEQSLLHADAESLFFSLVTAPADDPAMRLLSLSGALLLRLLEPDEAARRMEALLPALSQQLRQPACGALPRAAALAGAQLLRERMSECDAALRALPGQLEAIVLAAGEPREDSLLACLLRAALREDGAPLCDASARQDAPQDGLLLPRTLLRAPACDGSTLPLARPHTYVRRRQLPAGHAAALSAPSAQGDGDLRFACLCSAVLGRLFEALLLRSPIVGPVVPALARLTVKRKDNPSPRPIAAGSGHFQRLILFSDRNAL